MRYHHGIADTVCSKVPKAMTSAGKHDVQHVHIHMVHTDGLHLCNANLDSEMMTTARLRPVASQLTPHACEGSTSFKSTTKNALGLPTQSGQAVQQSNSQTHCLYKASGGPAHSVLQSVVELGQQVSAASVPHKMICHSHTDESTQVPVYGRRQSIFVRVTE